METTRLPEEAETLHFMGAVEAGTAIRRGDVSSKALTVHLLSRIEHLDGGLRSYVHVNGAAALEAAHQADREIARGESRGPLHGVPVALKDLLFTRDAPTTNGMEVFHGWRPDVDAFAVARLREAGAVLLGKLKMTEGAYAAYHPSIEAPLNPWDAKYWTGHSSSGAGVATAAGLCFASLGSDTGGSIRFPASANGLWGLKPTWGRVSTHGVFAMSPSLDHVGPLARSVQDLAAMLDAIVGWDPRDPASLRAPTGSFFADLRPAARGSRVGLDLRILDDVAPAIRSAFEASVDTLRSLGLDVVEVTLPDLSAAAGAWLPRCATELAHAHRATFPRERDRYGAMLREMIEYGMQVSGTELAAADAVRRAFVRDIDGLLAGVDALLLPVQPMAPPTIRSMAERPSHPPSMNRGRMFTSPFNLSGRPALSMPAGLTDEGLPVGVQLVGANGGEQMLLNIASRYEQGVAFSNLHPRLAD